MTISQLCKKAHEQAVDKGFWLINPDGSIGKRNLGELLMLIVSELGESCEGLRNNNPPSNHIPKFSLMEEELADAMIRIGDMAQATGCKLEEAINAKFLFNNTRPQKHGKEF